MKVFVYRDGTRLFPLRKVRVSIATDGNVQLDRSLMFAGPFFAKRLERKIARMKRRATTMLAYHEGYRLVGNGDTLKFDHK